MDQVKTKSARLQPQLWTLPRRKQPDQSVPCTVRLDHDRVTRTGLFLPPPARHEHKSPDLCSRSEQQQRYLAQWAAVDTVQRILASRRRPTVPGPAQGDDRLLNGQ